MKHVDKVSFQGVQNGVGIAGLYTKIYGIEDEVSAFKKKYEEVTNEGS